MMDMPPPGYEFGKDLFRLLVEYVEEYGIFAMDLEGRIAHWNTGAARTLGYESDEILGQHFEVIFTAEDRDTHVPARELGIAARTGRAEDERWHVRKDGSRFWAMGITVAIYDELGRHCGFGKILRDRTDIKELKESLKERADQLADADKNKDIVLATVAHELRNPMMPLQFCAQLLRRHGEKRSELIPLAELIERQITQVTRLINDLLDTTRISQGILKLERGEIDLKEVVSYAAESMQAHACRQKHTLHVALPEEPIRLIGDAGRLQQVVTNLIENSCKYTPTGGFISVELKSDDSEAILRVRDNGYGIPAHKMSSLFEFFTQAHDDEPAARDGLGIGLGLVRNLVQRHGGTIQAFSAGVDKGSEFTVRLPLCAG